MLNHYPVYDGFAYLEILPSLCDKKDLKTLKDNYKKINGRSL
jgi:hypothetical protein